MKSSPRCCPPGEKFAGRSTWVAGWAACHACWPIESAIERARAAGIGRLSNIEFKQGDVLALPQELDGQFDIVTVADVLYYLSPMSDDLLKQLATRIADLLAPGGICVLVNHFFFGGDADSKLSRRIHNAFEWSPRFAVVSTHRRPFYLVSLLSAVPRP
jgi:SAM-dependent methyltransferase